MAALGLHDTFRGHDAYVTIAENIGQPGCAIPSCGLEWITTRQPIVLDEWPASAVPRRRPITSIVSWRGANGPVTYRERPTACAHLNSESSRRCRKQGEGRFELALDIDRGDERTSSCCAATVGRWFAAGGCWRSVVIPRLHPRLGGRTDGRQEHVR